MTTNERRPPGRPRREELSDRQREVLDMLVAGKTNPEIAEELGISLDGAKYHVREICDRVGVDTREEAAEWWRQQRGLRARFAIAPAWQRIPRPVRWVGIAAGGAAACVAVVAVLLFVFREDEAGPESGVWLAIVVPLERTSDDEPMLGQVRAVNTQTDQEIDLGEPGEWHDLAWSPDGKLLYGLETWRPAPEESAIRLTIFSVEERRALRVADWTGSDQCECSPREVRWSPDGTLVALPAVWWTGVLTLDGDVMGTDLPGLPYTPRGSGGVSWAPDSSRYAYIYDTTDIALVDASGRVTLKASFDQSSLPEEVQGESFRHDLLISEWSSTDRLRVMVRTNPWDADKNEPVEGPLRVWEVTGTVSDSGTEIAWGSAEEVPDYYEVLTDTGNADEIPYNYGFPDEIYVQPNVSANREFTGGVTAQRPPRSDQPFESSFVTYIDGERFVYPLANWDAVYVLEVRQSWDMIRVP